MSISPIPRNYFYSIAEEPNQGGQYILQSIDPRDYFLPLGRQIYFYSQNPQAFIKAVDWAKTGLASFGRENIPLVVEMCQSTMVAWDPFKNYHCESNCPYIHHLPLLNVLSNPPPKEKFLSEDRKTESPTLSDYSEPEIEEKKED